MGCCGLTKYGSRELLLCTLAAGGLIALAAMTLWPLAVVPAAVYGWVLWFFRDPPRQPPAGEGLFISPADGTVTDVTPVGPESLLGRDGTRVGIFMSVFSVHVNRAPFAGRIDGIVHKDGAFLDVRDPAGWERNESATITMTARVGGVNYPVVFRQIAGLIARRIVTDLAAGQEVARGQRIGMIKFGSRMELLVPRELVGEVRVAVGRKVYAGKTVLIAAPQEVPCGQ